jgi:hypothetical protein
MRYAVARYKTYQRDMAYRIYVTDCLRMISENTANVVKGNYMAERYANVYKRPTKDDRSGAEIAADVIKRAGLVVVRNESI